MYLTLSIRTLFKKKRKQAGQNFSHYPNIIFQQQTQRRKQYPRPEGRRGGLLKEHYQGAIHLWPGGGSSPSTGATPFYLCILEIGSLSTCYLQVLSEPRQQSDTRSFILAIHSALHRAKPQMFWITLAHFTYRKMHLQSGFWRLSSICLAVFLNENKLKTFKTILITLMYLIYLEVCLFC